MKNIDELKESPLYSLSLNNLENFHTGFWKWVGDTYPFDFIKVFDDKVCTQNIEYLREVKHSCYRNENLCKIRVDLEIKTDTCAIYVENKLKSFPNNEQLEEYDYVLTPKSDNPKFILLSLVPKAKLPKPWQYMSYQNLCDSFKKIFNSTFEYKNDYHKFLIEDYIDVIEVIASKFPTNMTEKYDFYIQNALDEIELKDIYVKYKTSELSDYIETKLNNTDIYVGSCFNNKKGTIDIVKCLFKNNVDIGIQLEGNQYRYYINTMWDSQDKQANKIREAIATVLMDNGLWFFSTKQPQKTQIYESFCGYNPGFIYRYSTFEKLFEKEKIEEITYEQIANRVKNDIEQLEKNMPEILKIFNEHLI